MLQAGVLIHNLPTQRSWALAPAHLSLLVGTELIATRVILVPVLGTPLASTPPNSVVPSSSWEDWLSGSQCWRSLWSGVAWRSGC